MPVFNPNKKIILRKVQETKKVLAEVIPSPFFIEPELQERDVVHNEAQKLKVIQGFYERHGYSQISESVHDFIKYRCNSIVVCRLISHIATKLKFHSNKIVLNPTTNEIKELCPSETNFNKYITILEQEWIIRRTNKQCVYVVNHEKIFKGSYSTFIDVYMDTYKDIPLMFDERGRIRLDDTVNYDKQ